MPDWTAMGLAALFGAAGGLALDVCQDGVLDLPRLRHRKLYLGFLTDVVAGAVGGIISLMTSTCGPELSPEVVAQAMSGSGMAALAKAAATLGRGRRRDGA